jgi:chromodomain-helicase-DNA-binding protein 1
MVSLAIFSLPASTNPIKRNYVSIQYWPNKDAEGTKLRDMYHKLSELNKKAAAAKASSNGD